MTRINLNLMSLFILPSKLRPRAQEILGERYVDLFIELVTVVPDFSSSSSLFLQDESSTFLSVARQFDLKSMDVYKKCLMIIFTFQLQVERAQFFRARSELELPKSSPSRARALDFYHRASLNGPKLKFSTIWLTFSSRPS